jgi:hypothetical protein
MNKEQIAEIVRRRLKNEVSSITTVAAISTKVKVYQARNGIVIEYEDVPDEAFVILVFEKAALDGVSGVAKYRS